MPAKSRSAAKAKKDSSAKLRLAAEQAVPATHTALVEYNGARPEGLLGLIFLKYISDTFEEHRTNP